MHPIRDPRPMVGPVRALIVTLTIVGICLSAFAGTAAAHGELVEARPLEDAIVGGTIDTIELQFIAIAHPGDHRISVTGPDGGTVPTTGEVIQDLFKLSLPIEPLTEPGDYQVSYRVDGTDGDVAVKTYSFTYDPAAPEAPPLSRLQETGESRTALTVLIGATVFFGVALVAFMGYRLWSTR